MKKTSERASAEKVSRETATAEIAETAPAYAGGDGRIDQERKASLERELERIVPIIIEKYDPEKIIVFGSMVTGRVHESSDIDLVIIKKTDRRFLDRLLDVATLASPQIAVDFFVYTPEEFEAKIKEQDFFYVDEIMGSGKVLYERR